MLVAGNLRAKVNGQPVQAQTLPQNQVAKSHEGHVRVISPDGVPLPIVENNLVGTPEQQAALKRHLKSRIDAGGQRASRASARLHKCR